MYETYLSTNEGNETEEEKKVRISRRRAKINEASGYLGKIDEARALFEKIYNS